MILSGGVIDSERRGKLGSPRVFHMHKYALFAVLVLGVVGCGSSDGVGAVDGGSDLGPMSCPNQADSDGDGISDQDEGAFENPPRDTDQDGTPDYLDHDSDG